MRLYAGSIPVLIHQYGLLVNRWNQHWGTCLYEAGDGEGPLEVAAPPDRENVQAAW